ncbi:MAG: DNA topology modulation protein [Acidobacteria bacterium]|nr:DNA topology modulation protein [Acidobacteriota bacterium]
MQKILVVGSGGAGKSTLARKLGERLDIEVLHLDSFYWHPGWVEPPKNEWTKTVEQLLERESWVMDGNYSSTLDLRLKACDTVIFLDLPRLVCLWRVLKRAALYLNRSRPDMASGCRETFNLGFMLWVWNYPVRSRPKVLEMLREHAAPKTFVRLRSQADVERFLNNVRTLQQTS